MSDYKTMFGNRVYILAAVGFLGLLGILSTIPGVSVECSEEVCISTECTAFCNTTNMGSRSIYIYNNENLNLFPHYDVYVKYYGKWRFTNFTMDTRLGNIPETRKYVFVYPRASTKEFKIVYSKINTNLEENKLSVWSIPIGDRNMDEYGTCREYEIDKGVCVKLDVLGELL